jgi:putative phosphoribosyl transferase
MGTDGSASEDEAAARGNDVGVHVDGVTLVAQLALPRLAQGIVVFVDDGGACRHCARDQHLARVLHRAGLATLLIDLLGHDEASRRTEDLEADLLARRLTAVTRWARRQPDLDGLRVGYFGAGTGAAVALLAAAEPGAGVAAVVSRGGRPDLAGRSLDAVLAPTLLLVGGADEAFGRLNREAAARLRCPHRVRVVTGATRLFDEPGALDAVARAARDWFLHHLALSWARPTR